MNTPLHLAAQQGSTKMVKLLFSFSRSENDELRMLNQVGLDFGLLV